jgi:hypothetical protein
MQFVVVPPVLKLGTDEPADVNSPISRIDSDVPRVEQCVQIGLVVAARSSIRAVRPVNGV